MPARSSINLILLDPRARVELLEATRYYRDRKPGLGASFLEEIRRCAQRIRDYPEASPAAKGKSVRRKVLNRFPYNLIYVIATDHIRIVAVEHQSRRPRYWAGRL